MIVTVVGARPQFIKASVVSLALKKLNIQETIIHTGQHYDDDMSRIFWDELNIPQPAINLRVGSGKHGYQTAEMIKGVENFITSFEKKINALLLFGDTNSTLAGALVASKLHIPIIHVEAGLRSFNKDMPEEINRILTDRISDLLFCSSTTSKKLLKNEGITQNVHVVGDVMYDSFLTFSKIAFQKYKLEDIVNLEPLGYNLLTLHRPSNTDNYSNLGNILDGLSRTDKVIIWPVHPRVKDKLSKLTIPENIMTIPPQSYLKMLLLLKNSYKVFTDSGGLQKEAYWADKDCITLREETEWVETLENNFNILTGSNTRKIESAYFQKNSSVRKALYGNGRSSHKIAGIIKEKYVS